MNTTLTNSLKFCKQSIGVMMLLLVLFGHSALTAQTGPCMLMCPDIAPQSSTSSQCGVMITGVSATTTGDCINVPADQDGFYDVGETTVTFTATDGSSGLPVTCTTVIVVTDDTPPEITGCDNVTVSASAGECTVVFETPFAALSDNCTAEGDIALIQTDMTGIAPGDMLDPGTYQFSFIAEDEAGNQSAECIFTYTVESFPGAIAAIACNDEVQISLDEGCMVTVTADMILEGGPYGCFDEYTVSITNDNNANLGNTLTEANIGQNLYVTVTSPIGNACWGRILLEDKLGPPLDCIPVYTTCSSSLTPGDLIPETVTFTADLNPITSSLPAGGANSRMIEIPVFGLNGSTVTNVAVRFDISHEAVSELSATITSPLGVTYELFANPGTDCEEDNLQLMINPNAALTAADLATVCEAGTDVAATGSYQPIDDLSAYNGTDPNGTWIITVSDNADMNAGTINSVDLVLGQSGADISFPTTRDISYISVDATSYRVEGLDDCGYANLTYTDIVQATECDSPYDKIILRTWNAQDENGNESTPCTQTIYVYRNGLEGVVFPPNYDGIELPELSCEIYGDSIPGVEVTGTIGGELCDIIQVFPPEDTKIDVCPRSYKLLRKFKVLQWCSGEVLEHTQIIKVLDNEGPELETRDDVTISAKEFDCHADWAVPRPTIVSDCSDEFVYKLEYRYSYDDAIAPPTDTVYFSENVQGETIVELPLGKTWIKWTVTDECGNNSYQYFSVYVEDQVAPTAVCDEFTIVSVGGDGRILVDAITFDDGSHDNCMIASYEAAKMVDICSNNTSFGDQVEFCCAEIGNGPIMVQLRVTDVYGNSNTCMVEVDVQDKLPPYITDCPDDITLDCQADYEDLSITGEADGIDNCGEYTITHQDNGGLDNCGEGVITRTWTITDVQGLKNTCVQYITLENQDPFIYDDITWPLDYEATTCNSDLNPENLPVQYAYPRYDEGTCSLVATTYKDQVFTFVDGSCEKIIRTWTVIDWCTYDENNPTSNDGLYTRVQIIKLKNTEAPIVTNCNYTVAPVYGDCEGNVDFTLLATDDCTPTEDLAFEYEIDAFSDGIPNPLLDGSSNRINRVLPVGVHRVTWSVFDKCGNKEVCTMDLEVVDDKKPTPYCRGNIITAVMNSDGTVAIWARDFDLGSFDNCTPIEDLRFSFSTNVLDTGRVFSCSDIPDGESAVIPLRMYVTDLEGNQDFCEVQINVQDNESNFCDPDDSGLVVISGSVETSYAEAISGAQVTATRPFNSEPVRQTYTNENGNYTLSGLQQNENYHVGIYKNDDVRAGINTLDLVKIQRHILEIEFFDSPYNVIAADINNDEKLKASDLLALRKVILGITNDFPGGQTSWRFLPSTYEFDNSTNPWPLNEVIEIDDIQYSANHQNFIGVKIGDVDNSISLLQGKENTKSRSSKTLTVLVDDSEVSAGEIIEIPVYGKSEALAGMQFTLDTKALTFEDVTSGSIDVSSDNFGLFDERLTFSWNNVQAVETDLDEPLFTLVLRANTDISLSQSLDLNSTVTSAEAYDEVGNTMEVTLESRSASEGLSEFVLYQNKPNPFTSSTNISFYLPTSQDVTLTIYDVTGKTIMSRSRYFDNGVQAFDISNDELGVDGVLYYEVTTKTDKAIMKMISVR